MVKLDSVKTGISVVINTRNEEKLLPTALVSVRGLADEVVVVDMESSDASVEVAKKHGAVVIPHKFVSYVEPVRNFAVSKAKGPWILILDPDEEIPPTLAKKLIEIATKSKADDISFYRIARKNVLFGKWIKSSRWWPDHLIRFFLKGSVAWTEIIHGVPLTQGKGHDLEAKEDLAIIHHHYDSLNKYLAWSDRYAEVRLKTLLENGYKFSWFDFLRKPSGEFLSRYFFGQGYKDGAHGLALAILQAFAEFLVYAKAWEKEKFPDQETPLSSVAAEMSDVGRQFRYWQAESIINSDRGFVEKIKARVARKISSKK